MPFSGRLPFAGPLAAHRSEGLNASAAQWSRLLQGLAQVQPTMRVNNIDVRATDLINALLAAGLENHIDQYEMAMP